MPTYQSTDNAPPQADSRYWNLAAAVLKRAVIDAKSRNIERAIDSYLWLWIYGPDWCELMGVSGEVGKEIVRRAV